MEQTNKDKLKFKIARGILSLINEPLSYRKEAIIELFRVFDTDPVINEERAVEVLSSCVSVHGYLMKSFSWNRNESINGYWATLHDKLTRSHI